LTGQPAPSVAAQRCSNGASPGNTGEPGPMGGEMSHERFIGAMIGVADLIDN
jgi:hypothetical protein